ncbi:unnamed protein product [Urochloa decumbens]|uniref:Tryptophan decarboxylase n=1 Tax=Urochloa decumbens TaxID=240449 RepID=A0ABC8VSF7_9POAL
MCSSSHWTSRPSPATRGPCWTDFLAEYYRDIEQFPVRAAGLEPGRLPEAARERCEPMEDILDGVRRDILPSLTHWQSPSFFPANAGDMLSSGLNVMPFTWAASPAAAELEGVVVDWMASLLGLPRRFLFSGGGGGVLQGTTPSTLTAALSTDPEYLKNLGAAGRSAVDYKDWQLALSRRFLAVKIWVVLRARIRRHVASAKWFEAADRRFEVVAPRKLSLVCFRLRPRFPGDDAAVDDVNRRLLAAVIASGRAFMTHFVVNGKFVLRLAVGGSMTELRHVRDVWELLQEKADEVLESCRSITAP